MCATRGTRLHVETPDTLHHSAVLSRNFLSICDCHPLTDVQLIPKSSAEFSVQTVACLARSMADEAWHRSVVKRAYGFVGPGGGEVRACGCFAVGDNPALAGPIGVATGAKCAVSEIVTMKVIMSNPEVIERFSGADEWNAPTIVSMPSRTAFHSLRCLNLK